MKFKSIKMHNFMRYRGDNILNFSTDEEKNVTVVLGDNTFGKTTIAQAFRWGLYEKFNETSYVKLKDIVLLNNEVIAEMDVSSHENVCVEIIVENNDIEWKFTRKALFAKKNNNTADLSVKQIGETQLTMQIRKQGVWGEIINNDGSNKDSKRFKKDCVKEAIENMFPENLSNYFFFDGERWNDLKSKKNDVKNSIDTILGVSGLIEMKKHLKEGKGKNNVISNLRERIKGTSGEYERLEREIKGLEAEIEEFDKKMEETEEAIKTVERIIEDTDKTINDNRKIEEDQKELLRIENDIARLQNFQEGFYSDIVKEFSLSAKFLAAGLKDKLKNLLSEIDLQGKDIPGITVDTIDYLLEQKECLCGSSLEEGKPEYETLLNLRKLVPPEMIGGAAGKLLETLETYSSDTSEIINRISEKAESYSTNADTIEEYQSEWERLNRVIDRKTNLAPIRKRNTESKQRLKNLLSQKENLKIRKKAAQENKEKKEMLLDQIAEHDKANQSIYRAIAYTEALYEKADLLAGNRQNTILKDLNEIIDENFQRMFHDEEKYARLEDDYKIHVYYRNLPGYEEENLSNGETVAINFVFIVSILELAKQYKLDEIEDKEYGMENAILGLPLVLDGPFSALSNDNTSLVANRLPEFAEQVIIFMLDKDWEASGLEKYTLPEYCYRVNKEAKANSSSLDKQ